MVARGCRGYGPSICWGASSRAIDGSTWMLCVTLAGSFASCVGLAVQADSLVQVSLNTTLLSGWYSLTRHLRRSASRGSGFVLVATGGGGGVMARVTGSFAAAVWVAL